MFITTSIYRFRNWTFDDYSLWRREHWPHDVSWRYDISHKQITWLVTLLSQNSQNVSPDLSRLEIQWLSWLHTSQQQPTWDSDAMY